METMKDFEDQINRSFRKIGEGDIISGTVIDVTEEEVTLDLDYYTQGVIKVANYSDDPGFAVLSSVRIGDVVEAKVIKMDDGTGSIELSRREANEVLVWDKLKEMKEQGVVSTVKVREAVNAGVVAYLEDTRGFIPASQITTAYVEDLNEWVGKSLDVKIITVDQKQKKLVLSGKEVAKEREAEQYAHKVSMLIPGSVFEGTVEMIKPYGAFIDLGDGLSGLVHISQICQKRIASPNEVLKVGQKVTVKLLNTNDGKLSLSMKALEEMQVDISEETEKEAEEYSSGESVGTSLGDLLAKLNLQ